MTGTIGQHHPVRDPSEETDWKEIDRGGVAAAGCLMAATSALITGGLLFLNGSLVLATVKTLDQMGTPLMDNPKTAQFLVFTVPVMMVVAEWIMIDYVRRRLRFGRGASTE